MWRFTIFLLISSVILTAIGFGDIAHYFYIGSGISAILALAGTFFGGD